MKDSPVDAIPAPARVVRFLVYGEILSKCRSGDGRVWRAVCSIRDFSEGSRLTAMETASFISGVVCRRWRDRLSAIVHPSLASTALTVPV
jgi:hypothetical protein